MKRLLVLCLTVAGGLSLVGCGSGAKQTAHYTTTPPTTISGSASGLSAISAGTADCGNGRSAPAYAVSGDGFKPETYTIKTVTPKGSYLGAVTSVGGRVSMTVNTCDGAGAYTVKLIDTVQPRTFVAASVSWTR